MQIYLTLFLLHCYLFVVMVCEAQLPLTKSKKIDSFIPDNSDLPRDTTIPCDLPATVTENTQATQFVQTLIAQKEFERAFDCISTLFLKPNPKQTIAYQLLVTSTFILILLSYVCVFKEIIIETDLII